MFDNIGKGVQAIRLVFDHYLLKETYVKVYEVADPNSPLRYVTETYCCVLAESFSNYEYGHARSVVKL